MPLAVPGSVPVHSTLTVVLIVGPEFPIAAREKHKAGFRRDHAVAPTDRSGIRRPAARQRCRIVAWRHLPLNRPRVEVIGGQCRVRRLRCGCHHAVLADVTRPRDLHACLDTERRRRSRRWCHRSADRGSPPSPPAAARRPMRRPARVGAPALANHRHFRRAHQDFARYAITDARSASVDARHRTHRALPAGHHRADRFFTHTIDDAHQRRWPRDRAHPASPPHGTPDRSAGSSARRFARGRAAAS